MLVSPVQGVGPGGALGLASQPAAVSGKFQTSGLSQERRETVPEKEHLRLPSSFHMTYVYAPSHMYPQHTKEQS